MGEKEWGVFEVAARGFIRQFYPNAEYLEQVIVAKVGGQEWKSNGKVVLQPGWTVVDNIKTTSAVLPAGMKEGDRVDCTQSWYESKKTTAPPRFNKSSLIEAMGKVHNFVQNEQYRKKLRETSGLGTEATRTGIIEALVKRQLLKNPGGKLISSEAGRALIQSLPQTLSDPGMTALWEDALEMVSRAEMDIGDFMQKQEKNVQWLIGEMSKADFSVFANIPDTVAKKSKTKKADASAEDCPVCKEKSLVRRKSKKGSWYWGCFNKEKHPDSNPVFLPDKKGKPDRKK